MINSSKTEYAFWKLKILKPVKGQELCKPPVWRLSGNLQVQFAYLQEIKVEVWVLCWDHGVDGRTHIPEIPVQDFDVAMNDLQRRELVVSR